MISTGEPMASSLASPSNWRSIASKPSPTTIASASFPSDRSLIASFPRGSRSLSRSLWTVVRAGDCAAVLAFP